MAEKKVTGGERAKIAGATVRADFNDLPAVLHYTKAAHELGLWNSERLLIARVFPDPTVELIEAGCGAGRVAIGLWEMGYRRLTAFDFAEELIDQARSLAAERKADGGESAIHFHVADATALSLSEPLARKSIFGGALFMFNGLMQIPQRERRREALRELAGVCRTGAPFLFTTHDRDSSPQERALWRLEALRWTTGTQDPRLNEFGDRYFEDEVGRTYMHLPNRTEILEDLAATGWAHEWDAMRREVTRESAAVRNFSDECRFWIAKKN